MIVERVNNNALTSTRHLLRYYIWLFIKKKEIEKKKEEEEVRPKINTIFFRCSGPSYSALNRKFPLEKKRKGG